MDNKNFMLEAIMRRSRCSYAELVAFCKANTLERSMIPFAMYFYSVSQHVKHYSSPYNFEFLYM